MAKAQDMIDIWKTIVDVQMHFNEIEMKIRGLFLTIILALLGGYGYLIEHSNKIEIWGFLIYYYIFIPLIGGLGTYLFYFMDRHWYHRLLLGAVKQGIEIEKALAKEYPQIALGKSIAAESPVEISSGICRFFLSFFVKDPRLGKDHRLHSDAKIEVFYKPIIVLFIAIFVISIVGGGITSK
jgi:hypothetical protein